MNRSEKMQRQLILLMLWLLWTVPAVAAVFDHKAHYSYVDGPPCVVCHKSGAPSITPERKVCLECHDQAMVDQSVLPMMKTHDPAWAFNHQGEVRGDILDCSACHEQSFCLDCHKAGFADEMGSLSNNMINVHRSDFQISHPLAARNEQRLCFRCHEPRYCDSCHDSFRLRSDDIDSPSHRYTFDMGINGDLDAIHAGFSASTSCDSCHLTSSVAPSFHDWQIGHAREARRSLASCQACHPDGDICLKCHSAKGGAVGFNPHPDDWGSIKGTLKKASNGKTCRKCH